MIDIRQKELAEWQINNFGSCDSLDMALGMCEEIGELSHILLKRKQGIRGFDSRASEKIQDAICDVMIYGIQLASREGIDIEKAFEQVCNEILARDWKRFPFNGLDR